MLFFLKPIHNAFHNSESTSYRFVTPVIWFLIIASIVLFFVDISLPDHHPWSPVLLFIDKIFIYFFIVEYVLRIASYHPPVFSIFKKNLITGMPVHIIWRLRYAIHPLNLIDLLTILGGSPALRGLRALRLLRLLRLLSTSRLFRYSNPLHGVVDAVEKNKLLYMLVFSIIGLCTVIGGISIYLVERNVRNSDIHLISDGIWWALVTLTTVGYGDIAVISTLGKIIAGTLMISGMFCLALFAGVVGQTLLSSVLSIREEQFRMSATMNHLVICGYEPGARMLLDNILKEINSEKMPLVIFSEFERPADIPLDYEWIQGDPTKESALDKARLAWAEACIIVGRRSLLPQIADATTVLTIFTIRSFLKKHPINKKRKKDLYITAEILDAENVKHAETAGANEVIETNHLGFSLMSHSISYRGSGHIIGSIACPDDNSIYLGKPPKNIELPLSFGQLSDKLHEHFQVILLGVQNKNENQPHINPADNFIITKGSRIIYLARQELNIHQ